MTPFEEPNLQDVPPQTTLAEPLRNGEPRPERFCPNCGSVLLERKCKLLCPEPVCGYFMSCSDFY